MTVIGDTISTVARIVHLLGGRACCYVVAVEAIARTYPVVALAVAVDNTCAAGRRQVGCYFTVGIELEDTAVLNRAPCSATIAFGE